MPNRNAGPILGLLAALAIAGLALPAEAQQSRMTGMQLSGDEPIQIESDRLEVRDADNLAIFTGNVTVTQGETVMRAGTMRVFYSGEGGAGSAGAGDIERLEVDGGVHMRSGDQVATGDQGSFNMVTEVLVLTGEEVVLSEGDNVIMGCRLTIQMQSGQAQLDGCSDGSGAGRVRMLLQPGSQNR
jgi:lipopolysaccharide export system protein LptA